MNIVCAKKLFAVITVILTTAAFALPASAADDVSICNEDANCITQIETLAAQIEEVSDEDAAKAVDSAKQAIQSSDVDLHLLDGKLDYKTFSVYRFRSSQNLTVVTISADSTFSPLSNVTVALTMVVVSPNIMKLLLLKTVVGIHV